MAMILFTWYYLQRPNNSLHEEALEDGGEEKNAHFMGRELEHNQRGRPSAISQTFPVCNKQKKETVFKLSDTETQSLKLKW